MHDALATDDTAAALGLLRRYEDSGHRGLGQVRVGVAPVPPWEVRVKGHPEPDVVTARTPAVVPTGVLPVPGPILSG